MLAEPNIAEKKLNCNKNHNLVPNARSLKGQSFVIPEQKLFLSECLSPHKPMLFSEGKIRIKQIE